MTDKQIIIDGVPVQDCVFFYTDIQEEIVCDLYPTCGGCQGIDCYYKQRKNAEQVVKECHKYQAQLEDKLKAKEQECEELKEQLERADEDIKMKCTRCAMTNQLDEQLDQLKAENDDLKRELMQYEKDVKDLNYFAMKLKQTLTEIKEISETCSLTDNSQLLISRIEHILEKISEVEDV